VGKFVGRPEELGKLKHVIPGFPLQRRETCTAKKDCMDVKSPTLTPRGSWRERIHALRNIPSLTRIVWRSGPLVVCGVMVTRVAAALIPLAMLAVSKKILDAVQLHTAGHPLPLNFWWVVGAECALAALGAILGRAIGYCDSLLADRFTRHVSLMVMEHASRLDLASYEDPHFTTRWSGRACRPPTASP